MISCPLNSSCDGKPNYFFFFNFKYSQPESGRLLLASASRDRLIYIFDARKNYELIQKINDHHLRPDKRH